MREFQIILRKQKKKPLKKIKKIKKLKKLQPIVACVLKQGRVRGGRRSLRARIACKWSKCVFARHSRVQRFKLTPNGISTRKSFTTGLSCTFHFFHTSVRRLTIFSTEKKTRKIFHLKSLEFFLLQNYFPDAKF